MLDYHAASDRAVQYAVQTGWMPNMHLIHTLQRSEGFEACFGRAVEKCQHLQCRWFHDCMALSEFEADAEQNRALPAENTPAHASRSTSLSILGLPHGNPDNHRPRTPAVASAERNAN